MKTILILLLFCGMQSFSQWQQTSSTPQGGGITDILVLNDGTILATTSSYSWPSGQMGGIRRSTDGGSTWQNIVDVYNGRTMCLGSTGKIFASYWPYPSTEGCYYSTNGGLNWTNLYTLGASNNIFAIATKNNDNIIFLGTRDGVRRSTNGGSSFINLTSGFAAGAWIYDLDISSNGNYIAAGTSKGVYVSSNNGDTWVPVAGITQSDTIYSVNFRTFNTADGQSEKLNAGSSGGKLFETTDPDFLAAVIVYAFIAKVSEISYVNDATLGLIGLALSDFGFDNSTGSGFAYSTDGGVTWTQNNTGITNSAKTSALAYRSTGSTAQFYTGLFENQNNGAKIFGQSFVIGIQQVSSYIPEKYSLSQNYPNPFNPATNIEFAIPQSGFVKLTVYDGIGREVETLVNKDLKAGIYKADWNASKYSSGIYYYRIASGNFIETKTMILVK
jgi:hypothetical protein